MLIAGAKQAMSLLSQPVPFHVKQFTNVLKMLLLCLLVMAPKSST